MTDSICLTLCCQSCIKPYPSITNSLCGESLSHAHEHSNIPSHECSHKLNIHTDWVSLDPRQFLMGVVADRGYYYRGVLRGGRELSGAFLGFLRLSLRLLIRQRRESGRDVRGGMWRGCLFFFTPQV